jgi:hypothetical protein
MAVLPDGSPSAAHRLIEVVDLTYARVEGDVERVEIPGLSDAGDRWRELADRFVARLVARGRIVRRLREDAGRASVHLFLVEHPDLPAGEVYALFEGDYAITPYRCRPEDAIRVLQSGSAFNWT